MDLKFFLSFIIFYVLVLRFAAGDVLYLDDKFCYGKGHNVICSNIDSRNYSGVEYRFWESCYYLHFEESPYLSIIPSKLPSVSGLKISKTQVQNITSTDLSNYNLQKLDISSNKISFVSKGAFDNVAGLMSLNLSSNELQTLPADIFSKNGNLQILDLSYNKFSEDLEFLQTLASLNTLYMNGNGIRYIRPRTYAKLENLKELFLADNVIERLDYGSFPHESLRTLDLARNDLHQIHLGVFVTVPQLENLYLEGTQLELSAIKFLIRMIELHRWDYLKEVEMPSNFYSCVDLAEVIIGMRKRRINLKVREPEYETPNINGLACEQHY